MGPSRSVSTPIPVSVLGATGIVGQRFVARLVQHPGFELVELAASPRSAGRSYREACAWQLAGPAHAGLGERMLVACEPERITGRVVFSALSSEQALDLEPALAARGALVFSNAAAHREAADVPLVVPEVNPEHLDLLHAQRQLRGWPGGIVCNPNCTTAVLCMLLAPLEGAFGIEAVTMTSLQAASGAGRPGVPSLDLLGNVLPYIAGEEEKVAAETKKLLGRLEDGAIRPAALKVAATCMRVPVVDGHTESIGLRLAGSPGIEQVRAALAGWCPAPQQLGLHSAPSRPLIVHDDPARPQPRLDVEFEGGMPVHVGRIRPCEVLGLRMTILGHNVERGAAGGSVLNAELAVARGWLDAR